MLASIIAKRVLWIYVACRWFILLEIEPFKVFFGWSNLFSMLMLLRRKTGHQIIHHWIIHLRLLPFKIGQLRCITPLKLILNFIQPLQLNIAHLARLLPSKARVVLLFFIIIINFFIFNKNRLYWSKLSDLLLLFLLWLFLLGLKLIWSWRVSFYLKALRLKFIMLHQLVGSTVVRILFVLDI